MSSSAASALDRVRHVARLTACFVTMLTFGLLQSGEAARAADKRVALVIGNSAYQQAAALPNPRNDAEDMAATLKGVGFEVIHALDVDKRGMDAALARFNRAAKGATVALFYFAGHGMQYNGSNYILPVDAQLEDDVGLRYEAISLDQVRAAVEEASGVKIMILDACRNNPLASKLARSVAGNTRALPLTRGLARIEQTTGTVVAYATQANQVAEDGGGRNSPFTLALIENMREPGVEIASLFRKVAHSVHERTQGRQVPELSISLLSDFYLNQTETDLQAWNRVRNATDAASLRDFVTRFPSSMLADAARSRLDVVLRAERDAGDRFVREERDKREQEQRDQLAMLKRERELLAANQAPAPVSPVVEPRRVEFTAAAPPPPVTPTAAAPPTLQVLPVPTQPVAAPTKQTLAALPTPTEVAASSKIADDPKFFGKFQSEMRRLGCYEAANDKDWNGKHVKQALSLFATQASLRGTPAHVDEQQLNELQSRKARLCPSLCNARQSETSTGRCVAKTCGRGEILDRDGDCVDRPVTKRARAIEKPVARTRSIEREEPRRRAVREEAPPPRRVVRERVRVREVVAERRPRRAVEEQIPTEYRRPCTPGPSIGIGFGPIRVATPLGGRC